MQTILLIGVRGDKVSNQSALATAVCQKEGCLAIATGYPAFIWASAMVFQLDVQLTLPRDLTGQETFFIEHLLIFQHVVHAASNFMR